MATRYLENTTLTAAPSPHEVSKKSTDANERLNDAGAVYKHPKVYGKSSEARRKKYLFELLQSIDGKILLRERLVRNHLSLDFADAPAKKKKCQRSRGRRAEEGNSLDRPLSLLLSGLLFFFLLIAIDLNTPHNR